ncbi:unnamed protein product [Rodentolepis nana]|uniref:Aa_trans domain-containing protein n=1 Tax=Rodentolepis nana TaxID=102285 RepID=A0A0R3T4N2_RODNA|nr:unnamed protein product [Rodentolepis nana]
MMPSYGTIDDIETIDEAQIEIEINEDQEDIQLEISRKKTSIESALFNFLKGNIGTGILALPIAFKHAGLWLGFSLLLFYAILSTYVMHQLLRITEEVIVKNGLDRVKIDYSEAVFNIIMYGPQPLRRFKGKVKHTINAFLILTQIGFCCIYILFVSQNIKYFIEIIWPTFNANLYLIGFIVTLPLILLIMKASLKANALPSMLALVSMVIGLGLIFIYLFSTGLKNISSLPAVNTSFEQVLSSLGIFIFTFEGIALTLPLRNRMREPDRFVSTFGVLNVTMVITTCLCATIGFFGYLRFGDDILGSITYNIPNTPIIYSLVKPLFIFTIFLTYLLQFYVPALIFARLLMKVPFHRAASPQKQSLHRKFMRAGLVLLTYAIAMIVPHLDLMVSLLGAISSSVLAILAPPILEIVHYWSEREQIPWFYVKIVAKNVLIISVGVFSAVFGTTATVLEIARVMRQ